MLTGPLLILNYRKDRIYPHKLDRSEESLRLVEMIIQLFNQFKGKKRSEIEEELKNYHTVAKNPKVIQGLAKIMFHHSTFSHYTKSDPISQREKIFSLSAEYWKSAEFKADSLPERQKKIMLELGISDPNAHEQTEAWLFGDITGNQILQEVALFTQEQLLNRYNTEQVQGLLLNALELRLTIQRKQKASFRQLMQMLKFFRLMYQVKFEDKNRLTLIIDGPGSILENSRSYALELANFFPAVLLLDIPWSLKTSLQIKGNPRKLSLELDQSAGYRSHYTEKGVWFHDKMEEIITHFNHKYSPAFKASPILKIIDLKNNRYLLPDFSVVSDKKKRVKFEWIRYLSKARINWMLEIKNEIPENYIFVIKGKKSHYRNLIDKIGGHLLCFNSQLTAPAILKKFDEIAEGGG